TIVVGAPLLKKGEAYVFTASPNGWDQAAILTREDGSIEDQFGYAVGINGNTIVVGAAQALGPNSEGVVDVFVKPGTGWTSATETAELGAPDAEPNHFGFTVAGAGKEA